MDEVYPDMMIEVTYIEILRTMIESGADILLPRSWLSSPLFIIPEGDNDQLDGYRDGLLGGRFPNARPVIQGSSWDDTSITLALRNRRFGSSVDMLKALVQQREAQNSALTVSG